MFFTSPDIPSQQCQSTEGNIKHELQHWLHPFFIHHWTPPDRRRVATFTVALRRQYQNPFRKPHHTTTTVLRPFFQDHPGKPVPEENFWTLWCKGRLTEANTPTIQPGTTPSGLTRAHVHHPLPKI